MTRRRHGVACLVVGASALALSFTASPASAAVPSATGWWFELQTSQLPVGLPAPPTVPDGGLYVQQGANGPMAYGAVRADVADVSSATLLLKAAAGSSTSALPAAMQACATDGGWSPPASEPGTWDSRPTYTDQCVPGIVSSDGKAIAFYFESSFLSGGRLDVAIVPTATATPFAVAFDKPGDDALQTTIASAPAPPSAPSSPAAPASPSVAGSGAKVSTAPAAAPAAPAPAAAPAASAGDTRPNVLSNVLNVAGLGDLDRGQRMLSLGGASLIIVGWWLLSTRRVRMPRLLGALAGPAAASSVRIGGVGRFAKTRDRNPNLLR